MAWNMERSSDLRGRNNGSLLRYGGRSSRNYRTGLRTCTSTEARNEGKGVQSATLYRGRSSRKSCWSKYAPLSSSQLALCMLPSPRPPIQVLQLHTQRSLQYGHGSASDERRGWYGYADSFVAQRGDVNESSVHVVASLAVCEHQGTVWFSCIACNRLVHLKY